MTRISSCASKWGLVGLVALALVGCRSAKQGASSEIVPSKVYPHEIVVDFQDGTTLAQIQSWETKWGVDLRFNSVEGPVDGVAIARLGPETTVADVDAALEAIRANPHVQAAEPLYSEHEDAFIPNDPDFSKQWNLKMIHMPAAWDRSKGKGVVVAVIDTGIAYENYGRFHRVPDLAGAHFAPGYDFVNDTQHPDDDQGHGTHVAGTIAQATNNRIGVAGIAPLATLMPVKVLNAQGMGNSADIADAIRWAADHGAKVINLSLGGGMYSSVMANAVKYANKKGVTVVAAAGNTGRGKVEYPAAYPSVIAVGAVGPNGKKAQYSSWGEALDLVAPGGDKSQGPEGGILQNTIDGRDPSRSVFAAYQGTSMAAPHVAGVAALLYAAGAKSPAQVEQALYQGVHRIGGTAWSAQYGHGLLDAEGALHALHPSRFPSAFSPLLWGLLLLGLTLLTVRGRQRPTYFNVLFRPGFLVTLLLSTVGVFFAHWITGFWHGSISMLDLPALPIPDWGGWLFGRGAVSPLFYSALIPVLLSFIAVPWKALRPVAAGLAIGFGGFLGYAAWAHAPALSYLPFSFMATPWLVVNTLVCLFLARAMLRVEKAV